MFEIKENPTTFIAPERRRPQRRRISVTNDFEYSIYDWNQTMNSFFLHTNPINNTNHISEQHVMQLPELNNHIYFNELEGVIPDVD
jgi:hypothetical protein